MNIHHLRELLAEARKGKLLNTANALTTVIASIQTAQGRKTSELTEDEILKIIQREAGVFNEEAELNKKNGKPWIDFLVRRDYLTELLPKPVDFSNYEAIAVGKIAETGAVGIRDMGKVLKSITQEFGLRVDNGKMSQIVKNILSNS